jgi:peptidylprolyl isomerase
MPRSRRYRKSQNQVKAEWGRNNLQTKAKNRRALIIFGVIVAIIVVVSALLAIGGAFNASPTPSPSSSPSPSPSPRPTFSAEQVAIATRVRLQTSMGNITIKLRGDMPITTANFKNLTNMGVYDDTIFHRIRNDFMIQGGDPTGTGYGDPSIVNIQDEFSTNSTHNEVNRGTIAMANQGLDEHPDSGSSQFFISVVNNTHLYNKHPVFGDVTEGMDVVDSISNVQRNAQDRPLQDVVLITAELLL